MTGRTIVKCSFLAAPPEQVWARISRFSGVNAELRPLARMTYPRQMERLDAAAFPIGARAFRSFILLFGLLPVECDNLTLLSLDRGRGFVERSSTLTLREWRHERTPEPADHGCVLTDTLSFIPRLPAVEPFVATAVGRLFEHRHRRLRQTFGGRESAIAAR